MSHFTNHKIFSSCSKNIELFEHGQNIFELADGIGIKVFLIVFNGNMSLIEFLDLKKFRNCRN